jgi:small GTP-binding protein
MSIERGIFMSDAVQNGGTKKICVGILAHVDAGKTTLSEAMLYTSGSIRQMGRVDEKNAFLDTYRLERERGITIFSKQAMLSMPGLTITLLDTPGHVDFSAEMERTLQVLDYAVLVVSGSDGVQGHTRTLWQLLERYQIPVFLFVNKMDQPDTDRESLLRELQEKLSDKCTDFGTEDTTSLYESAALCEEVLLEQYLETGEISRDDLASLVAGRKIFPCYFGSALRREGVEALMKGLGDYTVSPKYGTEFGARVYKILRDAKGERLTCLKVTGGSFCVRDVLEGVLETPDPEKWKEKVNQIRIYSGEKYEMAESADAGGIYAVTGLTKTYPGEGLGQERGTYTPCLQAVCTYQILLPPEIRPAQILPQLRQLEEEEPGLHLVWEEELQEIQVQVMGQVQKEILQSMIQERFHVAVSFGEGKIVYKETIANTVEGVGHFEPLRHYAEVHLILEPGEPGSGMQFLADCREDLLDKNWQRLILTHLEEREHRGVLTGAPLTDMKITLAGGRAHIKHTEGGDFRQATYRAIRQGLMQAQSVLLEPYYDFVLEIPGDCVGRAMTDLDQMGAALHPPETEGDVSFLRGSVAVSALGEYQREVAAYTGGRGSISCTLKGYLPCHNPQDVIEAAGYDPDADMDNPSGSVFCSHGSGFYVEWNRVPEYMHLESVLDAFLSKDDRAVTETSAWQAYALQRERETSREERWLGVDEVDEILDRTFGANKKERQAPHKGIVPKKGHTSGEASIRRYGTSSQKPPVKKEKYLLVDGYNIIFAWQELSALAKTTIDGARGRLLDIMCDYQGIRQCHLIVVFDAYRVQGHPTEYLDYHNIHVVYTKEAETADQFIEKFAHENGRKYDVTVATSDGLEQIIILGKGCHLISAREFEREVMELEKQVKKEFLDRQQTGGDSLFDVLSEESRRAIGKERKT